MKRYLIALILLLSQLSFGIDDPKPSADNFIFESTPCGKFLLSPSGLFEKVTLSRDISQLLYLFNSITEASTTSLRAELKATLDKDKLEAHWKVLTDSLQGKVIARDKVEEGWENMTYTRYLTPMIYKFDNYSYTNKKYKGSVRLRFRKYFQRHIETGAVVVAPITDGKSFLEFKITNPNATPGLVLKTKHRVLVYDEDFERFLSKKGKISTVKSLIKNAFKIIENDHHESRQSLRLLEELLGRLRVELGPDKVREVRGISYLRNAFSINIPSADPTKSPIDVQVTIDKKVDLLNSDRQIDLSYPENVRVLEVKIPLDYAQLRDEDIVKYPGLAQVRKLWLDSSADADPCFTVNHGKFYHSQRLKSVSEPTVDQWICNPNSEDVSSTADKGSSDSKSE